MVDTPLSAAALITASADNSSGNWTNANQRALIASIRNIVPVSISAAGTTQGTAASISEHSNVITVCAAGAGVVMTATFASVANLTANACLLYPASGAQFWSSATQAWLSANVPISVGAGGSAEVYMVSTTQGYVWVANLLSPHTITGTPTTDGPVMGAQFLTTSGWTSTGWTGSWAAGWTNTAANTAALSFGAATVGVQYHITYTVTGRTTGSFGVSFGGLAQESSVTDLPGGFSASGAFGPTAVSTAGLVVTPTSDFNGTIVLSITPITGIASPVLTFLNSASGAGPTIMGNGGIGSIAVGLGAGNFLTTGASNTAFGPNAMHFATTGFSNTACGYTALYQLTTGYANTGVGLQSLQNTTTGVENTGCGWNTLGSNTIGNQNTAGGMYALFANTSGSSNTAFGAEALRLGTTGNFNTAFGFAAGLTNSGSNITAIGAAALQNNTSGAGCTAVGSSALTVNITGNNDTAVGSGALAANTGSQNTAVGSNAAAANVAAGNITAVGYNALSIGTAATGGTAVGAGALLNVTGISNTGVGQNAIANTSTGSNVVAVGFAAGQFITDGTTGNNATQSVYIGASTRALASAQVNQTVIGYTAIGHGANTTTIGIAATTATWLAGHLTSFNATAPAVAQSGGSGSTTLNATATDVKGTATLGTSATGCVITWNVAFPTIPDVIVTSPTGTAITSYTTTLTTLTIVCGAATAAQFTWHAIQ